MGAKVVDCWGLDVEGVDDDVSSVGWTELSGWGAASLSSSVVEGGSSGRGSSEGDKGGSAGASEGRLSGASEVVTTVLEADQNVSENMAATAGAGDHWTTAHHYP